jgi:DNA-binding IclR family transcriptional regulator
LQELQTELHRVRKNGYACDLEEHEPHIRCIAAPIWDHSGTVQASLSITAPVVRMPVSRLRQLAPMIQEAGLRISRELGYPATSKPSEPGVQKIRGREAEPLAKAAL